MRTYFRLIVAIIIFASCNNTPQTNKVEVPAEIEKLITEMTPEEKVGQMTQITLGVFYKEGKLQTQKLKEYIVKYNIGSVLNTPEPGLPTIEKWHEVITLIQDLSKESRTKIPVLYGVDAIHGVTYTKHSTLFPHNIGLAATWNPELALKSAQITAKEVRASGIRWNFDPVLGVGRQPLWPRFEETFGEDPLMVAEFGLNTIKGYEGDDVKNIPNVASCMKHFIGYTVPRSGKDRTPAYISDIELYNTFIPPFKKAVDAGSKTIMINSGSINGVPVHINKYLLTDLLKKEWGFDGLVVTDWEDILYLYKQHSVAHNNKEAVKMAINAGIDMSMVPHDLSFYDDLLELIKEGEVSMDRIDDAVRRILKVKYELGLFDNPYPEKEALEHFALDEYPKVALQAAQESMTLLKNDTLKGKAVLPLNKETKVLLAGPAAQSLSSLHGSWSYTWQGVDENVFPETTLTIKEALEAKVGAKNVNCISPEGFHVVSDKELKNLKKQARKADCIVLCLGEGSYAETAGNIEDLELSADQIKLAKVAAETGKPIVLILTEGRPRIIQKIEADMNGIIMAYRPASKGANAIADVLFGDYNPNGKLPFSYPQYSGNITTYDAPARSEKYYNPQWPYGFGLSYSTFEYGDIQLSTDTLSASSTLSISVEVKNTGKMDGAISTPLFVKDMVATVIPPMRKLRKYNKVFLKAGESKTLEFKLDKSDLTFINPDLIEVAESGDFEIQIADKKKMFYGKF